MSNLDEFGGTREEARPPRPASQGVSFLQMNFRGSETTWLLCQQEMLDRHLRPDVILVQDPPFSVCVGKNVFQGYRVLRPVSHGPCHVVILLRDNLRFRSARPFGRRVMGIELLSKEGPVMALSAYIRHTTGDGLDDLASAIRWAKSRSPRVIVGMDGNGHSPWWGPSSTITNPVGEMIENLILELDLEIMNLPGCPPTFVSDMGHSTWIDLTLGTRSGALSVLDWKVDTDFLTGSDHRAIFFRTSSRPLHSEVFRCKAWDRVDWEAFSSTVSQACRHEDFFPQPAGRSRGLPTATEIEHRVARITAILQEAIHRHVPEKRICWASKPWWSQELASARSHLRNLQHRAVRLGSEHDWRLYRWARRAFTSAVRKAKALAWRDFCAQVNRSEMWTSIQRILKPYQRLHVADLGPFDGVWMTEDAGKAEVLARRFFPTGPTTPEFQSRSDRRRQEVEDWLEEEWEDIPPVSQGEVQQKLLEMRALAAPGPDGIMAQCLQASRSVMVPCLTELFQRMLELGVHPASWKTARVLPVPKPGADLHSAKGYRPIALLNVLSKVMESLMKDRMSFLLETRNLLSDCQQGFRQTRSTELALWRFVSSATLALKTRHRCVAVALDIQSAYDTVDHPALLWKLRQKTLPRYMVAWTRAFLAHRTVVLRVNDSEFPYPIRAAVPQGSPLSPTLFLVYVDDLLQQLARVVHCQAFADDMFIWDNVTTRGPCPPGVQIALHLVETWSSEWGMTFNVSKCQAIDITTMRAIAPLALLLYGETVPQVTELKYLGVWVDSQLRWDHHIRECCRLCLDRLRVIRRLCATYWGLHPRVVSVLVRATIFPKLFYGVSAWGGVVRCLARLLPIDRVLRQAAVLTLGLLRTTSGPKALAVCGWLPADMEIRYALVRFILRQATFGRRDLLHTDYALGVNQRISALDIARREVTAFRASGDIASQGWTHLDTLQFWVRPPWADVPRVPARFLARDSAHQEVSEAQSRQEGIWVFTDGSVQDDHSGAAAVFEDPHGPFGDTSLRFPLGPLQSSTDAELAGIRGALSHLTHSRDWHRVTIVTDSQAAIQMLRGTDWKRCRSSIHSIQQSIQALLAQGRQVQLWWVPGHQGIPGNERADAAARAALEASRTTSGEYAVTRTMLEGAVRRWYQGQVRAQEHSIQGQPLEPMEEVIVHTDLGWTQAMPSRFMAARVGQFLTGHFPTGVYLHRFGHLPSPLCEECGVPDTRGHMLLTCPRWAFHRERLREWLHSVCSTAIETGAAPPTWGWDFLVGTSMGRLWLGRFLVAVRPRWSMRDQFQSESSDCVSEDA